VFIQFSPSRGAAINWGQPLIEGSVYVHKYGSLIPRPPSSVFWHAVWKSGIAWYEISHVNVSHWDNYGFVGNVDHCTSTFHILFMPASWPVGQDVHSVGHQHSNHQLNVGQSSYLQWENLAWEQNFLLIELWAQLSDWSCSNVIWLHIEQLYIRRNCQGDIALLE